MKKTFYAVIVLTVMLLSVFSQTACFKPIEKVWYGKPVGFKYYISSGDGTTQNAKSVSTVVTGTIAGDKSEVSLRAQERAGSRVIIDTDWTGTIDGELHREMVHVIESAELEGLPKPTPMRYGGGWNVFEITLLYSGGKERQGLPANPQKWHEIIEKIEQIALKNKP
jgi:hypothetical protein